MNFQEENRNFARTRVICKMGCRFVDSDQSFDAECSNMSGSGILFRAKRMVELGKALEIRVESKNRMTPTFSAFVEVVRCVPTLLGDYLIAGAIKGIKSE